MNKANPTVPYGFCHCGCGQRTNLARQNSTKHGYIKGEPMRYVCGHTSKVGTGYWRDCQHCGKRFRGRTDESKFCSTDCAWHRSGPEKPGWKGGVLHREGRTLRFVGPDHPMADAKGYVYEHRLVMAEHLGRPLASDEIVHHLNEDPSDNRLENLELMEWGEHSALHRQLEKERGHGFF